MTIQPTSRRTILAAAVAGAGVLASVPTAQAAPVAPRPAPKPAPQPAPVAPRPAPKPAPQPAPVRLPRPGDRGPAVVALQQRLAALGYWVPVGGFYGPLTAQAVMALQKVAGLERDGEYGPKTKVALDRGVRPAPRSRSGHVLEVDKARQILLVADNGRTARVYNVCTGGEYTYTSQGRTSVAHTPTGSFRVYRAVPTWETGPLGDMYRSHYLTDGIAIHGVRSPKGVGAYGASHGCVRTTMATQDELIGSGQLRYGTRVTIY